MGERDVVAGTTGATASDRVLTVPNVLSSLRLVGVPVFLWLILHEHDGYALLVLMASGVTDYLDGKIARRFGLVSRLGRLLDPLADRLYILTTLLGLAYRDVIPWWLVVVLLGREAFMALVLLWLRPHGYHTLPVHFIGKAATFNLLYAFPLMLLGDGDGTLAAVALPVGWAFAWWGTALYWLAALLYVAQAASLVRADRAAARAAT
ncbi:CDP-alcohol phosphatidyltransferase family protein [Angustibacter aerolatus]|uniref:CDP-diacylglycerol--glycerol-3-phosphate 3-phosphatidyltransferase n=1 Tax=Angustibacter aerolatus TaxID=1162965 RepID=A0ABQ6JNV2_9ACTN|nr:CDP-alcohol phosphatidyltransferase family protein [Angustibacter aerolatus]GMA89251.1 CDP-diacylglycerol--glycerol-3-phosphate 3-phosphatidyltransferase [Angustibacter aerolatus]